MTTKPLIELSLDAVILAVTDNEPRLLVIDSDDGPTLPSGPPDLASDPTLELGVRRCVKQQSGFDLGYVEQLYTFGDMGRRGDQTSLRPISIAYLALAQETTPRSGASWIGVYDLLPWEDHRDDEPPVVVTELRPRLDSWGDDERQERIQVAFGPPWDGIRVIERYELLYEAGLVSEYSIDRNQAIQPGAGMSMHLDHRRIAAVALARLRGKLTYRPVVFELLSDRFTLLELQRTVEALAGVRLHKQNFRRLVERSGLVEGTGERVDSTRGRPAELFRYRPAVLLERPRPGVGQPYR